MLLVRWLIVASFGFGAAVGLAAIVWLAVDGRGDPRDAARVNLAQPSPPPAPPPVVPVQRLSDLPAFDGATLARLLDVGEPRGDAFLDALAAAGDCAGFLAAGQDPGRRVALRERARAGLVGGEAPTRVRVAISLAPSVDNAPPDLPDPTDGLRLSVGMAPAGSCRAAWEAAGLPARVVLEIVGARPWPARAGEEARAARAADLVVDLTRPRDPAQPVAAAPIALYLWSDASRTQALGAVGHAAAASQDRPADPVVPPVTSGSAGDGALGGRAVGGDLARRAQSTRPDGGVPPVTAAPRGTVETAPLPPPLAPR